MMREFLAIISRQSVNSIREEVQQLKDGLVHGPRGLVGHLGQMSAI